MVADVGDVTRDSGPGRHVAGRGNTGGEWSEAHFTLILDNFNPFYTFNFLLINLIVMNRSKHQETIRKAMQL